MTYILSVLFLVLSFGLWQLNSRKQYALVSYGQGLLALLVFFFISDGLLVTDDLTTGTPLFLFALIAAYLFVHVLLSRFWKKKGELWPLLFILGSSALFFIAGDRTFNYIDFPVQLTSPRLLILPFLGAIIEPIANLKEKYFGNYFKIDFKNRRGFSRAIYFFMFGLFLLVAHFFGSFLGIALFSLGFISSLYYHKKSDALWNMALGLLAITSLGNFANLVGMDESSLLLGRVMMGLFFAGFVLLFINTIGRARKNQKLATFISVVLLILVPSALILGTTQNVNFGGGDAFIGLLVGFALAAAFGINTRKNDSVLSMFMAVGILLLPLTINKEEQQNEITIEPTKANPEPKATDPFEMAGKEIDFNSKLSIDSEKSQLTFELGPKKSRTKGAIKSFSGAFDWSTEKPVVRVEMPVKSLTTFNSIRDESLMDKVYFDAEKYPNFQFESSVIEKAGDTYILKGKFTMLGNSKELIVEMKYLGKSEASGVPIFIGRSSIDRTQFGMKPDPSEGNVVDFQFKVELKAN